LAPAECSARFLPLWTATRPPSPTDLLAPGITWHGSVTDKFPVPVDPKYVSKEVGAHYVTGKWTPKQHLTAETTTSAKTFTIYSVLWPERGPQPAAINLTEKDGALTITRPDGKTDTLTVTDDSCVLH
jgi:hypothetical protein